MVDPISIQLKSNVQFKCFVVLVSSIHKSPYSCIVFLTNNDFFNYLTKHTFDISRKCSQLQQTGMMIILIYSPLSILQIIDCKYVTVTFNNTNETKIACIVSYQTTYLHYRFGFGLDNI